MPQIIVTADRASERKAAVMLRERVTVSDFESDHFQTQLVERIGWAVSDADEVEQEGDPPAHGARAEVEPDRVSV